jgi:hypothetical protein
MLMRGAVRLGALRGVRLEPLTGIDARVDEIWARAVDSAMVTPVRDAAHYAWRFGATPSGAQRAFAVLEGSRTVAVCAIERRAGRAALIDMLAPLRDFNRLFRAVASACDEDALVTQLNDRGPYAAELITAGFVPRESKPFQVFAAPGADPAMFDAHRWYYTWGDGDVDQVL